MVDGAHAQARQFVGADGDEDATRYFAKNFVEDAPARSLGFGGVDGDEGVCAKRHAVMYVVGALARFF